MLRRPEPTRTRVEPATSWSTVSADSNRDSSFDIIHSCIAVTYFTTALYTRLWRELAARCRSEISDFAPSAHAQSNILHFKYVGKTDDYDLEFGVNVSVSG